MYVLYICKGTETIVGDRVSTTIYHEESPVNAKWCLVTYRNNNRYMAVRSDFFDSRQDAEAYMKEVEPMVPLISLGGQPRNPPLPYEEFLRWKKKEGFQEYDYKKMFLPDSKNPFEMMTDYIKRRV